MPRGIELVSLDPTSISDATADKVWLVCTLTKQLATVDETGEIRVMAIELLNNYDATTDPTVNDDEDDGYSQGSKWYNLSSDEVYVLVDATAGAAVWVQTTLTLDELGSMATQDADDVAITGGSITGVTLSGGTTIDGYVEETGSTNRVYATDGAGAATTLPYTTLGSNLLGFSNPSAISFIKINADNSVTARSASDFRADIGGTTVGQSFYTLANPSAITFPRINADNSVTARSANDFRTDLGVGVADAVTFGAITSGAASFTSMAAATSWRLGGSALLSTWLDSGSAPAAQILATGGDASVQANARFVASAAGAPQYLFGKSRGATIGDYTIVQASDVLGYLRYLGSDGTDLSLSSEIQGIVLPGSTPSGGNIAGQILVRTKPAGTAIATALTIDNTLVTTPSSLSTTNTTAATSSTTGALRSGGGLGVAGDAWIGGKAALKTSDVLVTAHGTMGATETIDASASDAHTGTLDQACTVTMSTPSASGRMTTVIFDALQNGTGGWAITWAGGTFKTDPASPAIITTANTLTRFVLTTYDGGTTWFRSVVFTGVA